MKDTTTKSHFRFLAFMLMISTFLPLIFVNLPAILNHHVWTILWFASLLILKSKILQKNQFSFVLVYGFVLILVLLNTLYIDVDEWNKTQLIREFYEITVAISVIVYFRMEGDYEGLAKIVKWTMIFCIITSIMSMVSSIINPLYARNIIAVSEAVSETERAQILSYEKYGGGGYSFASALVCLFPLLIYYYKNISLSIVNKKMLMLIIIIFYLGLIAMQIFANILVSTIIIALSWSGAKNAKREFIIIIFIAIIFYFIPFQTYIDILQRIAYWFDPGSELNYKFNDMAIFLEAGQNYDETGVGGRIERYPLLWESFQANPLFGHYLSYISYRDIGEGGHLFWMNKLGVYGLLGTIPFLFIIYKHIKISLKYFDNTFTFYFFLSMFSIIVLGAMKTLNGREFWYTFFIIVPGFYYLPLLKKKHKHQPTSVQRAEYNVPEDNPV